MSPRAVPWSKLQRLRGMGSAEIAHRAQECMRREVERVTRGFHAAEESDRRFLRRLPPDRPAFLPYLQRDVAPRFYVAHDTDSRVELIGALENCFPDLPSRIEAEANELCSHRFEVLGHGVIDHGAEIDWHRDPVTGARWPRHFWADYDLVGSDAPGDPKRVHEANRHQHLTRLAKAYFVLGGERYAREVVEQMLGWIDQNPRATGVHWHSSLEIALRAISWMWALLLILPSRSLDEAAARRIGKSLFAQLDHVSDYPSLYSSPNTHWIGEATALVLAGLLFADCDRGRTWLERGTRWLGSAVEHQVGDDGVHGELSSCYHCYALDFCLQALVLARRNQLPFSPAVERRVEAMLEFVAHVTRPDGSLPLLGDDDGGRALALERTDYRDPGDLLCTGAVHFGRADYKGPAGAYRETTLWLLGTEGLRNWEALPAAVPESLRASFPDAGYFVQRSGWGSSDSHLVFDCGGLGNLGGGHGHADALSLTLYSGGHELLVDPGTFLYNGDADQRDLFRTTGAHNTAVVDERPQSQPGGTFRWTSKATASLLDNLRCGGIDYLAGEHDGYARGVDRVIHRRRLLFVRPEYWIVLDEFRGDEVEHDFELVYHLAPDAEISGPAIQSCPTRSTSPTNTEARVDAVTGACRLGMFFHASGPLSVTALRGGTEAKADWASHRYGERRPAPVVVARLRARPPASVITLLLPDSAHCSASDWQPRALPARAREPGTARPLAVRMPLPSGAEDVVILSPHGTEVEAGPYRARAELVFARRDGERIERLFAPRAESFTLAGDSVLATPATKPFHRVGSETSTLRIVRDRESAPGELSCAV
ncbi:MAG TPA: alginate lyase family protein [Thermoanaerobaculia bacterium]|nr:alginate lyase family protein [Thermoanaerobaculia bacterium]